MPARALLAIMVHSGGGLPNRYAGDLARVSDQPATLDNLHSDGQAVRKFLRNGAHSVRPSDRENGFSAAAACLLDSPDPGDARRVVRGETPLCPPSVSDAPTGRTSDAVASSTFFAQHMTRVSCDVFGSAGCPGVIYRAVYGTIVVPCHRARIRREPVRSGWSRPSSTRGELIGTVRREWGFVLVSAQLIVAGNHGTGGGRRRPAAPGVCPAGHGRLGSRCCDPLWVRAGCVRSPASPP